MCLGNVHKDKLYSGPKPLGSETGMSVPTFLSNIVTEVPTTKRRMGGGGVGREKKIGKEEIKIFLFTDNMMTYIENHQKNLLELISEVNKFDCIYMIF